MNIDRENFKEHCNQIVELIASCDFLAFDCEFSGEEGMLIDLECYNFMANNGLDFNRIYSKGLSYIRLADRERLVKESGVKKQHYGIYLSEDNKQKLEEIISKVNEFEQGVSKELIIECYSEYLVNKIIKRQVGEKTPLSSKAISIEKGITETEVIVKRKKAGNERLEVKTPPAEEDIMGFTMIVQAIITAKRPIIGHYMGLDLFYFYDHFIDRLPNTFVEFVAKITEAFPYTIDTKVLAKKLQSKIKRLPLHLEGLYKCVVNDEKSLKKYHNTVLSDDPAFSKYAKEGAMHEAGFDSFITGVAFVGMCYYEKHEEEVAVKLKDVPQRTKAGKPIAEYTKQHELIYQATMQSYIDPKFPTDNRNIIHLRSGGYFYLHLPFQLARGEFDLNHVRKFCDNTVFVEHSSHLTFEEIGKHFARFGDVEVTVMDAGVCFVEFEQFKLLEGLEDKLAHIIPLLNVDGFKVVPYVERRRFTAFSYFK